MNNVMRFTTLFSLMLLLSLTGFAQNAEENKTIIPKATAITETPITAPVGKEVIITLKNSSERPIAIFAGPKEGIREPKVFTYGGLSSNNKLYVHENEVVCLMTVDKRPVACTSIKPGVSSVEVNSSANGISSR